MSLNAALTILLEEYAIARSEAFSGHPLADIIRNDIPHAIEAHIDANRYHVKASPGQGNWAAVPWIAVLDILITESAQNGFYIVYTAKEDLSGVYLSLNQGVTSVRQIYRTSTKHALKARAADFLARLGTLSEGFSVGEIDLEVSSSSSLGSDYEAGAVCSVFYEKGAIPNDEILSRDLREFIDLYLVLVEKEIPPPQSIEKEDDELLFENFQNIRYHKKIERNQTLARLVKKKRGFSCEACGFRYSDKYVSVGDDYIEAHHLVPISKLRGQQVPLDPLKDFAVLCANCHRMIHKTEFPEDIESFKASYIKEALRIGVQ